MAQQVINLGTNPNDGTGDNLREGGEKINENFTELYSAIVDGVVEGVTGDGVDNTDPANPVISFPTPAEIGAQTALGFTPENQANKSTDLTLPNNIDYPTTLAVVNAIGALSGEFVPLVTESNTVISDDSGGWDFELAQNGARFGNIRGYATGAISLDANASTLLQSGSSTLSTSATDAAMTSSVGSIRLSSVTGLVLSDTQLSKTGLKYAASGYANDPLSLMPRESVEQLIVSADTTGTVIAFAVPQIYGSEGTPETGNITVDTTGLRKGMTQLLIHNSGSAPTFGSQIKIISGAYATGELNYIMLMAVSSSRVLATISQEV